MSYSPTFNLEDCYKKLDGVLPNAVKGKVVTRFPPEPSGYMHIGHVKAALLNYHMAKKYEGKMIFRLDDTNPSKEKGEFVDSIIEDLHRLGINYDKISYSSDYFDYYIQKAEELILDGFAFCDNTPHEEMKSLRTNRIPSKFRDTAPEENLRIFKEMLKAKPSYQPGEIDYS
jgi:glutamyl-tRNA synthetase